MQCLAGQQRAQRQLYEQSLPHLSFVVRRYLAADHDGVEDVLQVAYASIFQRLRQFDPGRASFKTWATKIVVHACLKHRARTYRPLPLEALPLPPLSMAASVFELLALEDLINWLRHMPAAYYDVFSLYVIDELTHSEIAELLDITTELSRQRLRRGRRWLRQHLPPEYAEYVPKRLPRLSSGDLAVLSVQPATWLLLGLTAYHHSLIQSL